MPFDTVLLMAPTDFVSALTRLLGPHGDGRQVHPIADRRELDAIPKGDLHRARLISFTNSVIVPEDILAGLGYGAYNFHPGPPHFPGLAPAQMAIYHGASLFGITVHHMIGKVDAGPIVHADLCLVPPNATPLDLEQRAFVLLAKAFAALAPRLMRDPMPLPSLPFTWGNQKSSRRSVTDLCRMTPDLEPAEVDRRIRAFAHNGFGIDLTMTVGSHCFCLNGAPKPSPSPMTAVDAA